MRSFEGHGEVAVGEREGEWICTGCQRIGVEGVFQDVHQAVMVRICSIGRVAGIGGRSKMSLTPGSQRRDGKYHRQIDQSLERVAGFEDDCSSIDSIRESSR